MADLFPLSTNPSPRIKTRPTQSPQQALLLTVPLNPCSSEGIHDGAETGDENGVKQDGGVE